MTRNCSAKWVVQWVPKGARLRATVQQFLASGLISGSQADATRPKLSITVFDNRHPAQPPHSALPQLPVRDSRTTYRISPWR
jgi:hypothetical protein